MYVLNTHITIGTRLQPFSFVSRVRIDSSWKSLTDTAEITLPRKLRLKTGEIQQLIRKGDQVKIELGYNGELHTEFEGYVARLKAGLPIVIECEDAMWTLKQNTVVFSSRNTNLQGLLQAILPEGTLFEALDINSPCRI